MRAIKTTTISILAVGLLAGSTVGAAAQETTPDEVGPGVVSPGLQGMSSSEWASEIARLELSLGPEASVADQCAAGDLGEVFVALVDTEDLGACTIRDDQYLVRPVGLTRCGIPLKTHGKLVGGLNNRQARVAAEFATCHFHDSVQWEELSYTLDSDRTVIDDSFRVVGTPFEWEHDGSWADPGQVIVMPAGHLLAYEPLAAGRHTMEIDGIRRNPDPGEPGQPIRASVEFEVVPGTAE